MPSGITEATGRRSDAWFHDPDMYGFVRRAFAKSMGLDDADLYRNGLRPSARPAMCFGQKAASVRSQLSASSSFGWQEQSTGMAALLGHQLAVGEIRSAQSETTWAPGQRQLDANPEALAT